MTNAPVKDVKSLMNFVGGGSVRKTGGMGQTDSFGDVMSKTQGGLVKGRTQTSGGNAMKVPATDITRDRRDVVNASGDSAKGTARREEVTPEQGRDAAEKAGEEIVREVADELDVTEEEVARAMEELGLFPVSLLEPSNLTQLVLWLSGEQDQTALLTDENLFASLQNLLEEASGLKNGLMEETGMNPEELQTLFEELQGSYEQAGAQGPAGEMEAPIAEEPVITVEVKAGDETVRLAADENGNVVKTEQVVPTAAEENVSREKAGGQEQKESGGSGRGTEERFGSENPLLNALNQNVSQTTEAAFDQTAPFFSAQTQDIMDQIMDYMKIQLKPGMDQLQLQLHPESLGTVHIQITSRGGEITAQFHVQNEAVKTALESQVSTLQETLKEQGVKVEAVQVSVESHGFESNLWQGQGREENASSQNHRKAPRRINLNELDVNGLVEEDADEEEILAARMMEVNGNTVDYTA